MKIAIVNTYAPFTFGGAEYLAETLCQKLNGHGYKAMIIKVPFQWDPAQKIVESILATRLLHIENADKVISFKFPAYLVSHPHKIVWLIHQFRQAYDLWGTDYQGIPNTVAGHQIRQIIVNEDNHHLNTAKKIFVNSEVVANRLKKFNNIDSELMHLPLPNSEKFYCDQFDNYLFYPSRIVHGKRQYLAIEAMRYTKTPVKLVIAGKPQYAQELTLLQEMIERHQLQDKVVLLAEHIPEQQKIELMANCLGCVFIPVDEDYGYVSLEAFYSKKPIITCHDSGGVLGFVKHEETGVITSPEPIALAHYFDQLFRDKQRTKTMGEAGYDLLKQMNINWENVLRRLLK